MPVSDSDNFNRADNTSSMGSTSGGRTWVAHATGGNPAPTIGIISNTAYFSVGAVGGKALIDIGVDDYAVQVTLSTLGTFTRGLAVRHAASGDNCVTISTSTPSTNTIVNTVGGAGFTVIPVGWASGDVMRVECRGFTLKVFKNGTQIGSDITLPAGFDVGTRVGLLNDQGTTARFDDFSVTELVTSVFYVGELALA